MGQIFEEPAPQLWPCHSSLTGLKVTVSNSITFSQLVSERDESMDHRAVNDTKKRVVPSIIPKPATVNPAEPGLTCPGQGSPDPGLSVPLENILNHRKSVELQTETLVLCYF